MEVGAGSGEEVRAREGSGGNSSELTIKYSTELASAPYKVDINLKEMKRVLKDFGVKPKETGKIEVHVLRDQPFLGLEYAGSKLLGKNDPNGNKIEIFTDPLWEEYEQLLEVCDDIKKGASDPKALDKFREEGVIVTGRLPEYLEKAPPKRAREFLKKLAIIGYERKLSEGLLHETGHSTYDHRINITRLFGPLVEGGLKWVFFVGPYLGAWASVVKGVTSPEATIIPAVISSFLAYNLGLHLGYKLSPEEIGARQFGSRFNEYPNLMTIKRK
jgi:hypothetical protein